MQKIRLSTVCCVRNRLCRQGEKISRKICIPYSSYAIFSTVSLTGLSMQMVITILLNYFNHRVVLQPKGVAQNHRVVNAVSSTSRPHFYKIG